MLPSRLMPMKSEPLAARASHQKFLEFSRRLQYVVMFENQCFTEIGLCPVKVQEFAFRFLHSLPSVEFRGAGRNLPQSQKG